MIAKRRVEQLLSAAEVAGFDVIVTVDQNIPYQQNLGIRKIAILILCARTNRLRDLEQIMPAALAALSEIRPGQAIRIGSR